MARFLLTMMVVLCASCGDDGSPAGTDAGRTTDSGSVAGADGGSGGTDAGPAPLDSGVARRDGAVERMCPAAMDTRCGTACTGSETMCLCTCGGGGPDFTACDCVDGTWDCAACR